MAHDAEVVRRSRQATGLTFAVVSATSFGLAGPLGKGLMQSGWSVGAAVTIRVSLAALLLLVPAAMALRGRWSLLRRNALLLVAYGAIAVAGCQFAYFSAVARMQVGVALLIEYTAPVAVVTWLWLRHGQRPNRLTVLGAIVAGLGLVLVLDLVAGIRVDPVGVAWALAAMLGVATYFVVSAHEGNGLPPIVLAAGGLATGALLLLAAGALGLLDLTRSRDPVAFVGATVAWWVPVLGLGLVTAAVAYTTGIAAGRRLGSRLASFVALTEVVAALGFAWLLLGELPRPVQVVGGVLIVCGVVVVKLGETRAADDVIRPVETSAPSV